MPSHIGEDGYLAMPNLDVIKDEFRMFGSTFSIEYDVDSQLYGNMQDFQNREVGMTLLRALNVLFQNHNAGVLIVGGKSLGLLHYGNRYYFTDSYCCGPRGAPADASGAACVMECTTIKELLRICRRLFGNKYLETDEVFNQVFNIHHIDVRQLSSDSQPDLNAQALDDLAEEPRVEELPVLPNQRSSILVNTSVMMVNDAAQPDVNDHVQVSDEKHIHRKNKIAKTAHEPKAEEYGHFDLYPFGRNGLKEKRDVPITVRDYFQTRILGSDRRFREQKEYLGYALSTMEYEVGKATISACANRIQSQHGQVEDLHLVTQNLRGSNSYWRKALNELLAMIRCKGPPTYFITFSCNDLHWLDMRKALLIADNQPETDPKTLNIFDIQDLVERYPDVVSRHFTQRINVLLRFLRYNPQELGGTEVTDYWWRIKFQNRGSPHLHMVIWLAGHPPLDTPEGIAMLDKIVTCEMPSEDSDLYDLVKKCQVHRHTDTCKKNENLTSRFHFPRQVNDTSKIIALESEDFIRNGGRVCMLKCRAQDCWVNNYVPNLLRLWKGNMDCQPYGTNESIAYYIAKYIGKGEPEGLNRSLKADINAIMQDSNLPGKRKLHNALVKIFGKR